MGLSPSLETSKKSVPSKPDATQPSVQIAGNKLFAELVAKSVADLSEIDHRLFFVGQGSSVSWPHVVTKLIKEQLITAKELTDYGGIPFLKERFVQLSTKLGGQLDVDHDASDKADTQSESGHHRDQVENKYLEDLDMIQAAAPNSGNISIRDASPASSNGRAVFTVPEADSISGGMSL